jgi:hypothetical protein
MLRWQAMEGIKGVDVVVPWGAFILTLLSLKQNDRKKNTETKLGSIEIHDRTICNVLEGGRGVLERVREKSRKIDDVKVGMAATDRSHGIVIVERNFGI